MPSMPRLACISFNCPRPTPRRAFFFFREHWQAAAAVLPQAPGVAFNLGTPGKLRGVGGGGRLCLGVPCGP